MIVPIRVAATDAARMGEQALQVDHLHLVVRALKLVERATRVASRIRRTVFVVLDDGYPPSVFSFDDRLDLPDVA
jgi:hypothetical protein